MKHRKNVKTIYRGYNVLIFMHLIMSLTSQLLFINDILKLPKSILQKYINLSYNGKKKRYAKELMTKTIKPLPQKFFRKVGLDLQSHLLLPQAGPRPCIITCCAWGHQDPCYQKPALSAVGFIFKVWY